MLPCLDRFRLDMDFGRSFPRAWRPGLSWRPSMFARSGGPAQAGAVSMVLVCSRGPASRKQFRSSRGPPRHERVKAGRVESSRWALLEIQGEKRPASGVAWRTPAPALARLLASVRHHTGRFTNRSGDLLLAASVEQNTHCSTSAAWSSQRVSGFAGPRHSPRAPRGSLTPPCATPAKSYHWAPPAGAVTGVFHSPNLPLESVHSPLPSQESFSQQCLLSYIHSTAKFTSSPGDAGHLHMGSAVHPPSVTSSRATAAG